MLRASEIEPLGSFQNHVEYVQHPGSVFSVPQQSNAELFIEHPEAMHLQCIDSNQAMLDEQASARTH